MIFMKFLFNQLLVTLVCTADQFDNIKMKELISYLWNCSRVVITGDNYAYSDSIFQRIVLIPSWSFTSVD